MQVYHVLKCNVTHGVWLNAVLQSPPSQALLPPRPALPPPAVPLRALPAAGPDAPVPAQGMGINMSISGFHSLVSGKVCWKPHV